MPHHFIQGHVPAAQLPEGRRSHEDVPQRAQARLLQGPETAAGHGGHGKIDGPGLEFIDGLPGRTAEQPEPHPRIQGMEAVQPRQQPVAQGRLAGPQGDAARLQAHGLFQLFPAPAELLAARLHMGVEHAAFGRELHAATVADEQTAAQLALQGRHGARYRGLAGEQHGRRPAEVAAARHLVEYPAKLPVQLHALSCYAFLIYLRYQLSILPYQGPLL